MSEKDILVVSETSRDAKAAWVKFKDLFFDRPWIDRMFTHPVPMFVLKDGSEIIFISRDKLAVRREGWRGQIYPDSMINQVVRNRYGYS